MSMDYVRIKELSDLVWNNAQILRGDFKRYELGKIILPFVVLRRLDCILEDSKVAVLDTNNNLPKDLDEAVKDKILSETAGINCQFYNISEFTFQSIYKQKAEQIHANLLEYISKFSSNVREIIIDRFLFIDQLKRLDDAGLLFIVFQEFLRIDLHPKRISTIDMGYLFEDLIRRFSEISNETAGEHYTPREVIKLMVSLMISDDKDALTGNGTIRQVYDPAAGTGGMLSVAEFEIKKLNPNVRVELYGQEINPESYAICKSDMLVTNHNPENIAFGNTLKDSEDAFRNQKFHYMLSNPPYGVDWSKYSGPIIKEYKEKGYEGRFGAGLPSKDDGQLLFLQHMISKMREDEFGSKIAVVTNGSPLFSGDAKSGPSEIRRWMFENDFVESIIGLPTDIFYNTGIPTYIWLITNRKSSYREGKVQLINAVDDNFWKSLRRSLGKKRRIITNDAIEQITKIYNNFDQSLATNKDDIPFSKVLDYKEFAFRKIQVDKPLRLTFNYSEKGINELIKNKSFRNLKSEDRDLIIEVLKSNVSNKVWTNRDLFKESLLNSFLGKKIKLKTNILKIICTAFACKDEKADICKDTKGNLDYDIDKRDHEIIPFHENINEFFDREVLSFFPDAWINQKYKDHKDNNIGRIGYQVNFNRYFYKYKPLRKPDKIKEELIILESEIKKIMDEML